jgi:pSer/pThr/pTyr-binding forkhead associated (FHA) protein
MPAPPPSTLGSGPKCIACAAPIDPLVRACASCGALQVQLAPDAPEVLVPPPPSTMASESRAPSSVPPPPAYRTRPSLDAIAIPPLPRVPADIFAPPVVVPRAAPWRVVHLQNDGTEKTVASFEDILEVGRKGAPALADDPFVSPRHARFTLAEGGVRVEDLASLNGVFLRIGAQTPVSLVTGDVVLVGAQVLRFELLDGHTLPAAVEGDTNVFGAPAKPRLARLVEVTCDGVPRSTYVIGSETVLIGREAADIVFADDPHLSRRHAEVRVVDGQASLVDLGSSNGTYVRLRGEAVLASGAQVRIGQQRLRVERLENRGGA